MPDVPQDFREEVSRQARKRARAMTREVRRRPDALVTLTYEDAHSGEPFEHTTTVRELAQEHLEKPGPDGAACERQLMEDLQAAVERRRPRKVRNEPVITLQEIVAGLRLDKDGAVYHSPHGCVIQSIYFSEGEVDQAESEPIRNEDDLRHAAAPGRRGGVQARPPLPRGHRARPRAVRAPMNPDAVRARWAGNLKGPGPFRFRVY